LDRLSAAAFACRGAAAVRFLRGDINLSGRAKNLNPAKFSIA
jgi:hypothetical protein